MTKGGKSCLGRACSCVCGCEGSSRVLGAEGP